MRQLKWIFILVIIIFLVGCSTDEDLYSGIIEGEEIPILSETSGSITELHVDEGDSVKNKRLLAKIDDRMLHAQLKEAQAGTKAAKATLDEAIAGARSQEINKTLAAIEQSDVKLQEISIQIKKADDLINAQKAQTEQIESQLMSAKSTLKYQQEQLDKLIKLYQQEGIPQNQVDAQKEIVNQSEAQVKSLEAQLKVVAAQYESAKKDKITLQTQLKETEAKKKIDLSQLSLLEEGATEYTITKLYGLWEQAQAREEQLQLMLEKTTIFAPIDGVILRKNISLGEVVKPNFQMFTLLNLEKQKVKVYVPEARLNEVSLDGNAEIMVDAYPNRVFKGKITYISEQAEFTPKNVQTPDERTKMVFAVIVEPTEGFNELKPGMPADIRFIGKGE